MQPPAVAGMETFKGDVDVVNWKWRIMEGKYHNVLVWSRLQRIVRFLPVSFRDNNLIFWVVFFVVNQNLRPKPLTLAISHHKPQQHNRLALISTTVIQLIRANCICMAQMTLHNLYKVHRSILLCPQILVTREEKPKTPGQGKKRNVKNRWGGILLDGKHRRDTDVTGTELGNMTITR